MNPDLDSWARMLAVVQTFHDNYDFKRTRGEELNCRIALMTEEPGENSSCLNRGSSKHLLTQESADR